MKRSQLHYFYLLILLLSNTFLGVNWGNTSDKISLLLQVKSNPPKVISFPINVIGYEKQKKIKDEILSYIEMKIINDPRFHLVARDNLNQLLKEQGIEAAGIIDSKYAAKIGKIAGVDAILFIESNFESKKDNKEAWKKVKKRVWPMADIITTRYDNYIKGKNEFRVLDTMTGSWICMDIIYSSTLFRTKIHEWRGMTDQNTEYFEHEKLINIIRKDTMNSLNEFLNRCDINSTLSH